MTPRRAFPAVLVVLLCLCAPFAALRAQDEGPASPPDAEAAALELVDEIARQVEAARGLAFQHDFTRQLISPEEIRDMMKEMQDEEMPPEKLAAMTRLYSRMGFFAQDVDLVALMTEMLEAGALGFYDPDRKGLFLVRGFSVEGARPTIYHELVHALEDQHFDLGKLGRMFEEDTDRQLAVKAVVEGSAQSLTDRYLAANPEVMRAFQADQMGKMKEQMQMLAKVPVVIVGAFAMFPYTNSPAFVTKVTGGDPGKVADLYADLPASTEQVLHPEKYGKGGDYPYRIEIGDLTAAVPEGWKRDLGDALGELMIGFLLNEFQGGGPGHKIGRVLNMFGGGSVLFQGDTLRAAEGWDGDRLATFFGPGEQEGFVWASRWDSERDAVEFAGAYLKGLPYKREVLGFDVNPSRVEIRKDRVMVVEGFPAESIEKVMAAAWAATTFEPDERDGKDAR